MTEIDALSTLAEVAIGLAGFSGIVLALSRRGNALDPWDAVRMAALLGTSLIPAFVALVPAGAIASGLAPSMGFRLASGLAVPVIVAFLAVVARMGRRIDPASVAPYTTAIRLVGNGAGLVNIVLQSLNALWLGTFWPLYLGLMLLLGYSCVQFALILCTPARRRRGGLKPWTRASRTFTPYCRRTFALPGGRDSPGGHRTDPSRGAWDSTFSSRSPPGRPESELKSLSNGSDDDRQDDARRVADPMNNTPFETLTEISIEVDSDAEDTT